VVFVIGSNTTENHPVIGYAIKRAVKARRTKVILADPREIPLSRFAAIRLQAEAWNRRGPGQRPDQGNPPRRTQDKAFIAERTDGFEAMEAAVEEYTPQVVEKITGVPAAELRAAARMYAEADSASIVYAMGITQHVSGTDNVKALATSRWSPATSAGLPPG